MNQPSAQTDPSASDLHLPELPSRHSLGVKLMIYVILVISVTGLILGTVGYLVASRVVRDQIHRRLSTVVADRSEMVLSYIAQQKERAELVASRTQLRRYLARHARGGLQPHELVQSTKPILLDAQKSTPEFLTISIVSPMGTVLTSTDDTEVGKDLSAQGEFQIGLKDSHLGGPFQVGEAFQAWLASPLPAFEGRFLGVAMVRVSVDALHRILTRNRGFEGTNQVLIGRFVICESS